LGLASTKGNTRAAALKAARERADPEFVKELIQLVDDRDPYATMALNALAYSFTPESSAKVREVASDEAAERELRERAIALLAVTKDREMLPMLTDLANGPDQRLGKIAFEVIKVLTAK
jgi:HEAT repeat protein